MAEVSIDDGNLQIDGRVMKITHAPRDTTDITPRFWQAENRKDLTGDGRAAFNKACIGPFSGKGKKFTTPSLTKDGKIKVETITVTISLIKALEQHWNWLDIAGVCTIVDPVDIHVGPHLRKQCWNLFRDYPRLTLDTICRSNITAR